MPKHTILRTCQHFLLYLFSPRGLKEEGVRLDQVAPVVKKGQQAFRVPLVILVVKEKRETRAPLGGVAEEEPRALW